MFGFTGGFKKNKELDAVIQRIEMNVSNNYKDAAQEGLREFEAMLEKLGNEGKVKGKQKVYYEEKLSEFKYRMKKFTHKDQKPTWV